MMLAKGGSVSPRGKAAVSKSAAAVFGAAPKSSAPHWKRLWSPRSSQKSENMTRGALDESDANNATKDVKTRLAESAFESNFFKSMFSKQATAAAAGEQFLEGFKSASMTHDRNDASNAVVLADVSAAADATSVSGTALFPSAALDQSSPSLMHTEPPSHTLFNPGNSFNDFDDAIAAPDASSASQREPCAATLAPSPPRGSSPCHAAAGASCVALDPALDCSPDSLDFDKDHRLSAETFGHSPLHISAFAVADNKRALAPELPAHSEAAEEHIWRTGVDQAARDEVLAPVRRDRALSPMSQSLRETIERTMARVIRSSDRPQQHISKSQSPKRRSPHPFASLIPRPRWKSPGRRTSPAICHVFHSEDVRRNFCSSPSPCRDADVSVQARQGVRPSHLRWKRFCRAKVSAAAITCSKQSQSTLAQHIRIPLLTFTAFAAIRDRIRAEGTPPPALHVDAQQLSVFVAFSRATKLMQSDRLVLGSNGRSKTALLPPPLLRS